MSGKLKCDKCGLEAHEDRFGIEDGQLLCDICREKMESANKGKPKVLVIDDQYFMLSYARRFLGFCNVKHAYRIPEDESTLAEYEVLVVDGDGIGNSKYKHGIEFCKAYEKQGNNKVVIYHSGLSPHGEDKTSIETRGVKILVKGGNPDRLVDAVKEAVV